MPQPSGTSKTPAYPAVEGLIRNAGLSRSGAESFCELIRIVERYPANSVVSSATSGPSVKWILSGWTCEVRVLSDGRRQIFSFGLPGDPVLARPVNASSPCIVMALTNVECIDVAQTLARAKEPDRPEFSQAINNAVFQAQERRYEDIIRLCRRSALQRLADLFVELYDRLDAVGLVDERGFFMPLTQEHLADTLGLSVVHVNRSLKALRLEGLATFRFGRVSKINRERLAEVGLS